MMNETILQYNFFQIVITFEIRCLHAYLQNT